jgi:uncharacterized protein (DUF1800 family)
MSLEAAIAVHRFGLGARPEEMDRVGPTPKAWLMSQLDRGADQPQSMDGTALMTGGALVAEMVAHQRERAMARRNGDQTDPVKEFFKSRVGLFNKEIAARFALGFTTQRPFAERLVRFWSNHFVVSAQNPRATTLVGAFEREAIRPNIHRTFEDMLLAAMQHPAMLLYLDNAQSVGPDSLGGMISRKGLNENLGRELMELYTLGVDGGYTQADVVAMAKLLTGWTIDRKGQGENGFFYARAIHEPGSFALRGKSYASGWDGTVAAIKDLARDPATARHVAQKFAVHFIQDTPTDESCARLEKTFVQTNGDLKALAETAVNDPQAWRVENAKMRSPVEYVTAAFRLVGWPKGGDTQKQVRSAMSASRIMGEFPLAAPSPKGWPDTSDAWSGPDAILNRVEWAEALGEKMQAALATADVARLAEAAMGPLANNATLSAIRRASSGGEALALLVSSPEFQRR